MKKILVVLTLILSSHSVFATNVSGKITGVLPFPVGGVDAIFIKIDIESTSNAPIACNATQRFVMKSTNNPHFALTQSSLLAAMMAGTSVKVSGNGLCDTFNNAETFTYICLGDVFCGF